VLRAQRRSNGQHRRGDLDQAAAVHQLLRTYRTLGLTIGSRPPIGLR
jgi:hypothetical protein